MIEWKFTPDDVARIRLAFSPLLELVLSLIVLRAPARHSLHVPWIKAVRPRLTGIDLSEIFAIVPVRGIVADFLSPPPTSPLPDLAEELDTIRHSPPERIIDDLVDVPGVPPHILAGIRARPRAAVHRIADTLQRYWDVALAEQWPRIRTLLDADVLWRARRLADGGARALFADLHPSITWHGDRLTANDSWEYSGSLSGEGLLLVPGVMAWPTVRKMVAPYQPMIAYPARGIATLWETGESPTPRALADLLGRTRAQLLTALAEPLSTTTLARQLAITTGAVSQHLSVLHSNGLVSRARVGGSVLYRRTARGDSLVTPAS